MLQPFCWLSSSLAIHAGLAAALGAQHRQAGMDMQEQAPITIAVKVLPAAGSSPSRSAPREPAQVRRVVPSVDASPLHDRPDEPESLLPVALPAEPTYHVPAELDSPPRVVQNVPLEMAFNVPDLPPQMLIVRLLINELGEVDKVVIEESSLPAAAEGSIIQSFLRMRFEPGWKDNIPVKSQIRIEVNLDLPTDADLSSHS